MHIDQQVIDLATGIQRRRDFAAHITGFAAGAVVWARSISPVSAGPACTPRRCSTWATALSFQHFRHVLRGPVTADAVGAEAARRSPNSCAPLISDWSS